MKKLISLLMALTMMLMLASCAASPVDQKTEPEPVEEDPAIEEQIVEEEEILPVKAAVFWYDFTDAFLSTVREALDEDLKETGIEFTNYDAQNTQDTQDSQIDEAIANGANLLIVNIVDTAAKEAAQGVCDKAKDAGIPIIFFNREVDDSVVESYENACFVGTRAAEPGELQGQMIGEYLVENYDAVDLNGDGLISYILMKGELGCQECEMRTQYSVDFCNATLTEAGYPELVYYDPENTDRFQPANWSKATAFDFMTTALETNPMDGDAPIELAICNNDDMALGVMEALNNVGWNEGDDPEKTIPDFGIDYTVDAAEAIDTGKITGSILQSYSGMAETVTTLAKNVQAGKHVFDSAEDLFYVDEGINKIRVPYEIKMKEN